jgi:mono/diheme cytochrome c family protein
MRARERAALRRVNEIDDWQDRRSVRLRFVVSILLIFGVAFCGVASAQTTGKAIYDERCAQCHGIDGRGNGAAAPVLMPRPRDFAAAQFKVRTTETGSLPTDDDLIRTITYGVLGTSMPGWQKFLSTSDIAAVASYVKSFSPRFAADPPQSIPTVAASVPGAPTPQTAAAGKAVYEKLRCAACHGTDGKGTGTIATDLKDAAGRALPATNLTEPWTFRGGATPQDVYLRFRTGMNGTPMPSFVTAASETELRNLAAYVLTLARKPVWDMTADEVSAFYQAQAAEAERDPVRRGGYVVSTIGCSYCHTPVRADGSLVDGMLFAGGQKWTATPFGDFVSYNLTSDRETGLGGWGDDQIKAVLTRGIRPDGSRMLPYPMPWPSYASLSASDLNAVVAYLRTIPPISNRIPAPTRPNIVSYLWGKFQLLILKKDMPLVTYPGNAGSAGGE